MATRAIHLEIATSLITRDMTNTGIEWHFNLPSPSHMEEAGRVFVEVKKYN